MKKIILLFTFVYLCISVVAQTQVNIGPQSSTFSSWVRGYHFVSPTNFTICALYIPTDASTGSQNIAVVRFTGGAPPAFPATTNAFVNLFTITNFVPNTTVACNVVVNAGDVIGVYGARSAGCVNSYDGANFATTINGMPTTLRRSGMQQCLAATPMANIWSEVNFSVGRIFMYYNCCPSPTVTAAASTQSVCLGGTSTLTAGGATTYTWNPGGVSGSTITVSPTVSTTYTVTGSQAGCQGSRTISIGLNPTPTITALSNTPTICSGNSATITPGGATSYTLNPGGITGTSFTVTPLATTIYTVSGTNAFGCIGTRTISITVNPTPTISISSNAPVCTGNLLTFSVNPLSTYTWSGPGGYTSNLQTPSIANASVANSGTYSLTVSNAQGCRTSGTINIAVFPRPNVLASSNSPVCAGSPINLASSGGTAAAWTGPSGFTSATYSPVIASASVANAGNYSVTVTDVNGCTNTTVTNVVINPLPVIGVLTNTATLCAGNIASLTPSGALTYTLNPSGLVGTSFTVSPPATVIYTISGTNVQGCIGTRTVAINVNANPTITLSSNAPVCTGSLLSFSVNPLTTYTWSGPGGFTSNAQLPSIANASVANSGTYSLTVLNAVGCSASGTLAVTVFPRPLIQASSNSPVCTGNAINLSSSGGTSASWSGPAGFSSFSYSPSITNATAVNAGNYSVTVTDANGCTNATVTSVMINPLPVIAVTNPTACTNGILNFSANGGTGYSWQGPVGFSSTVQTPSLGGVLISNSGGYTVTVTSAAGCSNTAVSNATVFPLPIISVANNGPVCANANLSLTATGGSGYVWAGPNGYTAIQQNPVIMAAQPNASGNYTVVVSNAQSCTNTAVTNVTVHSLPTPSISSNAPLCQGQNLTLNGSGGLTYSWQGPNNFSSVGANVTITNASPFASGNYTLTVTDANACTQSAITLITVNPLPIVTANGSSVCIGQNLNLAASGGVSYAWNGPNGFASNQQNPIIPNATQAMAGFYQVTVTDANGCSRSAVAGVSVNPVPNATATSNAPICEGQRLQLFAGGSLNYSWNGPNGFNINSQNPVINATSLLSSGIYTVRVIDAIGCYTTVNVPVTIYPNPLVDIKPSVTDGCEPQCITFTAQTNATGTNVVYAWNLDNAGLVSNTSTVTNCYNTARSYSPSIKVTDGNGCSNSTSVTITVHPKPNADFTFSPIKPSLYNNTVDFTDLTNTATIAQWNWYFGNNVIGSTSQNPSHRFDELGDYLVSLIVNSEFGCTDTVHKLIRIEDEYALYVPNAFTPNGDGKNDMFQPKGSGFTNYELYIFDRWGERLFYSNDFATGWDGTFRGLVCQDGVYTFKINLVSIGGKAREITGSVTLYK